MKVWLALVFVLAGWPAWAQQIVTVAWDASPTANVSYNVYRDTTLVGTTNALTFPIPVLTGPHTLGVTASLAGVESVPITLLWAAQPPQPTVSPNCSEAMTGQSITDSSLAVWSIGTGQRILRNGTQAGNGLGSRILWSNGLIYVLGTDNNYWRWNGNLTTGTPATWSSVGVNKPACGTTPVCTYTTPTAVSIGSTAGTTGLSLSTQTGCAWTASSAVSWLSVPASGVGSSTVPVVAQANAATTSRTGTLTIANRLTTVTQAGSVAQPPAPPSTCSVTLTATASRDANGVLTLTIPAQTRTCP